MWCLEPQSFRDQGILKLPLKLSKLCFNVGYPQVTNLAAGKEEHVLTGNSAEIDFFDALSRGDPSLGPEKTRVHERP